MSTKTPEQSAYSYANVFIKEAKIISEVADTNHKQRLGLSNRKSLEPNSGMLFVYNKSTYVGYWMKDMLIPIDIIWVSNGRIVKIDRSIHPPPPNTSVKDLEVYFPTEPVNYVLEVNAGYSDRYGFEIGDIVRVEQD